MQSYLKYIFLNIEKLYNENQELLTEDKYRPCKSVPRDIFAAFDKFKQYYNETKKNPVFLEEIIKDVLNLTKQNDTVNTNIRLMQEFGFLITDDFNTFTFTDNWKKYIEENKSERDFITDELKKCKKLTDFNMVLNSVLCTLREGYFYGEIISFPDSDDKFKQVIGNKETRLEFCRRVYQMYGFHGRNREIDSDSYTPNANYRVLSILRSIGFIEPCEQNHTMKTYNLTEDAVMFLKEYNKLLGGEKMPEKKPFENFDYKVFDDNDEKRYNRIIFGAPGTGKSHQIDTDKDSLKLLDIFERVTFHPNYTYSQFVGTYKPVSIGNGDIEYKYVEGPFMRLLVAALENAKDSNRTNPKRYLLIIEEINRANVAAAFGDMFQLLDRKDGVSEYEIQTSEDVRKYLADKLGGEPENYKTLKLPNNFYIWATMNSADQGVQPMDAAFKRRWDFEYLNIDSGAFNINIPIPMGTDHNGEVTTWKDVDWNDLRNNINNTLKKISGVNEDKLLGPFFIGNKEKLTDLITNKKNFNDLFKSKVLMYLYEDVVKMQPSELFNVKDGSNIHYSDICKDFDAKGLKIFVKSIYNQFDAFKDGDAE